MPETIATTLSALAGTVNGTLRLRLDESIYSEATARRFAAGAPSHVRVRVKRRDGVLWLELEATDLEAARLQIGNALTELLRQALHHRT